MATRRSGSYGEPGSFRMLILGETGSGKTELTEKILRSLTHIARPGTIRVLDFAPDYGGVGRPLRAPEGFLYFRPRGLRAPRLEGGRDCGRVWELAEWNAQLTTMALKVHWESPVPGLVVNDASIHFHRGSLGLFSEALRRSRFVVVNAYWGERLRDECGVWEAERQAVERLESMVDLVWRL